MITNKRVTLIVASIMACAVSLVLLASAFSDQLIEKAGGTGTRVEYSTALFDTGSPIEIDILMDEGDFEAMLENAISEQYTKCDVVVNGKTYSSVGVRPKGNTSLSSIVNDADSDRYSLKLEFDQYIEGQTCCGLDKLILNNNYADASSMKEALIYDMFAYLDADASLYNYAKISVNGEYYGVYLALEAVEDSFLLRNYGANAGELYKPDSMDMGGGEKDGDFPGGEGEAPAMDGDFPGGGMSAGSDGKMGAMPDGGFPGGGGFPGNSMNAGSDGRMDAMPDGGMGGMGGDNGSSLNYTDDALDSYSAIWDGEVTKSGKKDHRRVVTALKAISEGEDVEGYMNVDAVLRYMAVHTFAVNLDSLSGNMAHNYYLYEEDGKLSLLPWDYNLSFGGFSMGGGNAASTVVNFPIDTPFSGVSLEDREFFAALLQNEAYLSQYHEYLRILCEDYVFGGAFDAFYESTRERIDELTRSDPNAFYSYDEYEAGATMLNATVKLRAKSIEGQLEGSIPATSEGQNADSSALVDASSIDIDAMGGFMNNESGEMGTMRRGLDGANGEGGASEGEAAAFGGGGDGNMPGGFAPGGPGIEAMPAMPQGMNESETAQSGDSEKTLLQYGLYLLLVLAAVALALLFKRKRWKEIHKN